MSKTTPEKAAAWPGFHARGDGALGYILSKHLAGSPVKIGEDEFIAWALERRQLDPGVTFALREVLDNMDAEEARIALFDGRAPVRRIAELVVQVGADSGRYWNALLAWAAPDLEIARLDPGQQWEWNKLALCGEAGRDAF